MCHTAFELHEHLSSASHWESVLIFNCSGRTYIALRSCRFSGFIPEFVGRFPKKVPLHSLDEQKLYDILTQKENNILAQKELLYQDFGVCTRPVMMHFLANIVVATVTLTQIAEKSLAFFL